MALDDNLAIGPQKAARLYTIGEAADLLEVSVPTIRYYESEGLVIPIRRKSGHRRYSEDDLNRIRSLRKTINVDKVSIAGIKQLFALIPCWILSQCAEAVRRSSGASNELNAPCWMTTDKNAQSKSESCRPCPVYTMTSDCTSLKQKLAQLAADSATPQEGA